MSTVSAAAESPAESSLQLQHKVFAGLIALTFVLGIIGLVLGILVLTGDPTSEAMPSSALLTKSDSVFVVQNKVSTMPFVAFCTSLQGSGLFVPSTGGFNVNYALVAKKDQVELKVVRKTPVVNGVLFCEQLLPVPNASPLPSLGSVRLPFRDIYCRRLSSSAGIACISWSGNALTSNVAMDIYKPVVLAGVPKMLFPINRFTVSPTGLISYLGTTPTLFRIDASLTISADNSDQTLRFICRLQPSSQGYSYPAYVSFTGSFGNTSTALLSSVLVLTRGSTLQLMVSSTDIVANFVCRLVRVTISPALT